jgi:hypothetical protein
MPHIARFQNQKKNLGTEEERFAKARKAVEANAGAAAKKQSAMQEAGARIANAEAERAGLKQAVEDLQNELQCLAAGMATQGGPGQKAR